jgi:putative transposase
VSAFRLIDAEKASYPVAVLCRMLGVSKKSGYYAWRDRPPSRRTQQDALLTEKIREIHSRSRETYGYPRIHAELRSLGIGCGQRRVARLMKAAGLRGCVRGKKRGTTRRDPRAALAPDLLHRNFVACRPNKVWLADITYVPTQEEEGFLYLAFILDTHSRRIVGWSMASHMRTELVIDALEMAVWRRRPSVGSCIIPTVVSSTRRSRSVNASKRSASSPRWEGPEPILWTTLWRRASHRYLEDRARASTSLS